MPSSTRSWPTSAPDSWPARRERRHRHAGGSCGTRPRRGSTVARRRVGCARPRAASTPTSCCSRSTTRRPCGPSPTSTRCSPGWQRGEPLQYVLGRWAFRHLDLMIDRRVLIPRPETEEVAGTAIDRALERAASTGRPVRCADLGTGSGAIGLALASELATHRPPVDAQVWLTDVSDDALDVARANLAGVGRGAPTVRFAAGSWFAALPTSCAGRWTWSCPTRRTSPTTTRGSSRWCACWEPPAALFAGSQGLDAYEHDRRGGAVLAGPRRLARAGDRRRPGRSCHPAVGVSRSGRRGRAPRRRRPRPDRRGPPSRLSPRARSGDVSRTGRPAGRGVTPRRRRARGRRRPPRARPRTATGAAPCWRRVQSMSSSSASTSSATTAARTLAIA